MRVTINGEDRPIPDGCTVSALIASLELEGRRLAVEVNEEVVPRGLHAERRLRDGDRVEIVHAIGGG